MEDVLEVYLRWFTNWSTTPFRRWLDRQHKAVQWTIKGIAVVIGYSIAVLLFAIVVSLVQALQ